MLKVKQVAQRLNLSLSTVYVLIESGQLEHYRCPGIRISEEQIKAFLDHTRRGTLRKKTPPEKPKQIRTELRHIRI